MDSGHCEGFHPIHCFLNSRGGNDPCMYPCHYPSSPGGVITMITVKESPTNKSGAYYLNIHRAFNSVITNWFPFKIYYA